MFSETVPPVPAQLVAAMLTVYIVGQCVGGHWLDTGGGGEMNYCPRTHQSDSVVTTGAPPCITLNCSDIIRANLNCGSIWALRRWQA